MDIQTRLQVLSGDKPGGLKTEETALFERILLGMLRFEPGQRMSAEEVVQLFLDVCGTGGHRCKKLGICLERCPVAGLRKTKKGNNEHHVNKSHQVSVLTPCLRTLAALLIHKGFKNLGCNEAPSG